MGCEVVLADLVYLEPEGEEEAQLIDNPYWGPILRWEEAELAHQTQMASDQDWEEGILTPQQRMDESAQEQRDRAFWEQARAEVQRDYQADPGNTATWEEHNQAMNEACSAQAEGTEMLAVEHYIRQARRVQVEAVQADLPWEEFVQKVVRLPQVVQASMDEPGKIRYEYARKPRIRRQLALA